MFFVFFVVQNGWAQVPATGTIAFTGARVIDGTGRPAIEQATIVVKDGKIDAIGPSASVKAPAGATIVNVAGKTIMPGLINAHGHVNLDLNVKKPVVDQLVQRLQMYASYGVTTVVSLGSELGDEAQGFVLRDEQRKGTGPAAEGAARFYDAGRPILYRPGPTGKETADEARKDVDRHAALHADIIKFHLDGTPLDMKTDVVHALIDEAHKNGLRTAVHIVYLADAKKALDNGIDVLAHGIRDQDVDAATIAQMKQRGVGYIPTLTRDLAVFAYETTPAFFDDPFFKRGMSLYENEVGILKDPAREAKVAADPIVATTKKMLAQGSHNLKMLSDAGITIAMGTDSGASPDRNPGRWQGYFEHVELEMMVKAGLTPSQALVAGTSGAAKVMKLQGVGSLAKGNWADLLVLNANPLTAITNTRNIDSVYIAGRKIH